VRGDVLLAAGRHYVVWSRRQDGAVMALPITYHRIPRHRSMVQISGHEVLSAMGLRSETYLIHTAQAVPMRPRDLAGCGRCPQALVREIAQTKERAEVAQQVERHATRRIEPEQCVRL
jgi:hypothetical protein